MGEEEEGGAQDQEKQELEQEAEEEQKQSMSNLPNATCCLTRQNMKIRLAPTIDALPSDG